MKALMQLMSFDDAKEVASRNGYTVGSCSIYGIQKNDIDWGHEVSVEFDDLKDKYYICHRLFVPSCCFKSRTESLVVDCVLRYGTILTDDELFDFFLGREENVRIRLISYEGDIYYLREKDGETMEFKKVGVVG
nr:MAG TPA: hypothetical protein [Caudoviricetes sp.]